MPAQYRHWLTAWCAFIAVFGLVLFTAGWPGADAPARFAFATLGHPFPDAPDRYLRFTTSLMGAVTFGWAVTLYAAFRALWALDPIAAAPVWRITTVGAALWYLIDSAASIANGFATNGVSNTLVMVLYAIPVLASGVLKAR